MLKLLTWEHGHAQEICAEVLSAKLIQGGPRRKGRALTV